MNPENPIKIKVITYMMTDCDGRFIKVSPVFKVIGYGKSIPEANNDFEIAIKHFIEFHRKCEDLSDILDNITPVG